MTKIKTLTAGIDLDKLIVEKLMGGFCTNPDAHADTPEVWYYLKGAQSSKPRLLRGDPWQWDVPGAPLHEKWDHQWVDWSPSTNIAHAWQIVELMGTKGLSQHIGRHRDRLWHVQFCPGYCQKWEDGVAETAEVAICLAALSWVQFSE